MGACHESAERREAAVQEELEIADLARREVPRSPRDRLRPELIDPFAARHEHNERAAMGTDEVLDQEPRQYPNTLTEQDDFKRAAAEKALELVRDGMLLGLGSGTTVRYFTEGLGRLVAEGMKVRGVPTSRETAELAAVCGIPIITELVGEIDLAVDGADEVDPALNLIKGRGGALFREKIVAAAAKRFVVVADE